MFDVSQAKDHSKKCKAIQAKDQQTTVQRNEKPARTKIADAEIRGKLGQKIRSEANNAQPHIAKAKEFHKTASRKKADSGPASIPSSSGHLGPGMPLAAPKPVVGKPGAVWEGPICPLERTPSARKKGDALPRKPPTTKG